MKSQQVSALTFKLSGLVVVSGSTDQRLHRSLMSQEVSCKLLKVFHTKFKKIRVSLQEKLKFNKSNIRQLISNYVC